MATLVSGQDESKPVTSSTVITICYNMANLVSGQDESNPAL